MRYGNVAVKYTTWEEDEGTSVSEQRGPEHAMAAGSTAPSPGLGETGSGQAASLSTLLSPVAERNEF